MEIVALESDSVRGDSGHGAGVSPPLDLTAGVMPALRDRIWRDDLRLAIRDAAQLIATLELPATLLAPARMAASKFPLFAPWSYVARMKKGDPADPLLRQVLPLADELNNE